MPQIPDRLPIQQADPIPWYTSSTMLAGAAQVVGGVALTAVALLRTEHQDLLLPGVATIGTGLATLRGRARAEQPIVPTSITRLLASR